MEQFKNWATIAASLVGITVGLITLTNLYRSRAALAATFSYGDHLAAPSEVERDKRLVSLLKYEQIAELVTPILAGALKDVRGVEPTLLAHSVASSLSFNNETRSLATSHLSGYWIGSVVNAGATTLNDVTLYLPSTVEAAIQPDGKPETVVVVDSAAGAIRGVPAIALGDMRPGDRVVVNAWTSSRIMSYETRDIRVTHSSGYGTVNTIVPVGRVGQWAEAFTPLLVFGAVIVGIIAVVSVADSMSKKKTKPSAS